MLLFGHRLHIYEDRATHRVYQVPQGGYVEIPDAIGVLLLEGHPDKLCDVTSEPDPGNHVCPKTPLKPPVAAYEHTAVTAPTQTTAMGVAPPSRMSPQKRRIQKAAQKRSRIARLATK